MHILSLGTLAPDPEGPTETLGSTVPVPGEHPPPCLQGAHMRYLHLSLCDPGAEWPCLSERSVLFTVETCVKAEWVTLSSWVCGLGDGEAAWLGHRGVAVTTGSQCDQKRLMRSLHKLSTSNVLFPLSVVGSGITDVPVCMPCSSHKTGSDQKNLCCLHCFFVTSIPVLRIL